MKKGLILGLLASSIVSSWTWADEYKEVTASGGEINWTKGHISAEGFGIAPPDANPRLAPLLACRAASVDAQRNVLETLKGTRVTATTTVENFILVNDKVQTTLEGVVKGARITNRNIEDGVCTISMSVPMEGNVAKSIYSNDNSLQTTSWRLPNFDGFASILNTRFSIFEQAHANEIPATWIEDIESRLNQIERLLANKPAEQAKLETSPTGLVIDARGSNFIPSMSPKVRELRGSVIYPNSGAISSAIDTGRLVSLFATDVDFAIRHPKVGERPLLLKALRTYGDTRTEIIIGKESSDKLREMIASTNFADASVIIVLD